MRSGKGTTAALLLLASVPAKATGWSVSGAGTGGLTVAQALQLSGALQASGGDASQTMVKASYSSVGQTEQQRISRVLDVAELGARGDAASTTAAFNRALAIAVASPGTTIHFGPGTWALTSPGPNGFAIPSSTTVAGDGMDSSTLTWNDNADANGGAGAVLFTTAYDASGSYAGAAHDITFHNLRVRGSWDTNGASTNWGYPFLLYNVTNLTFDGVASDYARAIAVSPRNSTNVIFRNGRVSYSARDGVNMSSCTDMSVVNNLIEHTDDDSIALHSANGEPWGARRDMVITGNRLFDVQGIKLLAARSAIISGNTIDNFRDQAVDLETVEPNGGSGQEGVAGGLDVVISGNVFTNAVNREYVDNLNESGDYITITGTSARAGSYAGVPGTAGTDGVIHNPYLEFNANSTSAGVPTAGNTGILIADNVIGRFLPPADGTDSRYKTWTDLGMGPLFSRNGLVNKPIPLAAYQGTGVNIYGGVVGRVQVVDNIMSGIWTGLQLGGGTDFGDVAFRGNHVSDMSQSGVQLNTTAKGRLTVEDNIFDIDPYQGSPQRGAHGTWTAPGQTAIYSQQSPNLSVNVLRNTFRNVYSDSNVDSSAPPTSWLWQDNILQADPNSIGYGDTTSRGVGLTRRSAGTRLQQLDSDPSSPTYGQVLSGGQTVSGGVPTAGKWLYGDYVREGTPSAAQPFAGYFRATTGTGQALGTDWWPVPLAVNGALSWGPFSVVPNGAFAAAVVTYSNFYASPTAAVPITVTLPAPPSGGTQATAHVASMQGAGNSNDFSNHGAGYTAGTAYPIVSADGVTVGTVTPYSNGGFYLGNCSFTWTVLNRSAIPSGPFTVQGGSTSAVFPAFNLQVLSIAFDVAGTGYVANQPVTFSGTNSVGAASGTAILGGTIWTSQPIALDPAGKMTVQEDASGKVVISSGGTRLFSIDSAGNVIAKGTVTQNGSP